MIYLVCSVCTKLWLQLFYHQCILCAICAHRTPPSHCTKETDCSRKIWWGPPAVPNDPPPQLKNLPVPKLRRRLDQPPPLTALWTLLSTTHGGAKTASTLRMTSIIIQGVSIRHLCAFLGIVYFMMDNMKYAYSGFNHTHHLSWRCTPPDAPSSSWPVLWSCSPPLQTGKPPGFPRICRKNLMTSLIYCI